MGGGRSWRWDATSASHRPAQDRVAEVKLGLARRGGHQRLPRAIGVEAALNMIVSGACVIEQFKHQLIDEIIEGRYYCGYAGAPRSSRRPLTRLMLT